MLLLRRRQARGWFPMGVLEMFHGSREAIIEQLFREEPWKDYQKSKEQQLPWMRVRLVKLPRKPCMKFKISLTHCFCVD